jgi:hypothetical protein
MSNDTTSNTTSSTGAPTATPTFSTATNIKSAEQANAILNDAGKRASIAKSPGDFSTLALRKEQTVAREFLQRQASGGAMAPTHTMPAPTTTEAAALAPAWTPVSAQDTEQLVNHAKVQGLSEGNAQNIVEFARDLGLTLENTKALSTRLSELLRSGELDKPVTPATNAAAVEKFVKAFGSREKAAEVSALARKHIATLAPEVQRRVNTLLTRSPWLNYSPEFALALAGRGRLIGGKK